MRSRFDRQLEELHTALVELGALCESAISLSAGALLEGDREKAARVMEQEAEIDRREREIERLCLDLLLRQQPVAADLRTVSSALKMLADLERIGDQAADIAELAQFDLPPVGRDHIRQMAQTAIRMVTDSVEAFVSADLDLAAAAIEEDDRMDELFREVRGDLVRLIREGQADPAQVLDLLMVAKYFERIGDHAVNVAEWVQFALTGRRPGGEEEP